MTLTTDAGQFKYLHMRDLQVRQGQTVAKGDRLGLISNLFLNRRGEPVPTTRHLHFEIWQPFERIGLAPVAPYTSLVAAYQALGCDGE